VSHREGKKLIPFGVTVACQWTRSEPNDEAQSLCHFFPIGEEHQREAKMVSEQGSDTSEAKNADYLI
jgi:hypothetical protein